MTIKEYLKMPKETHGTGGRAANQITGAFLANQCAVDSIKADYGEDLLIQPSFDGEVEHFKIWVQVKGTTDIEKYRQASGEIVRYIDFAHMFKWLRSKELCVLVLWDIEKEKGLFFLPKAEVDEWDFYTQRKESIRVVFDEENVLTAATLPQLIWRARYEHYAMLVSHAAARQRVAVTEENRRYADSMYSSVLVDFLRQVDLIVRGHLTPEEQVQEEDIRKVGYQLKFCEAFRIRVLNACSALEKKYPDEDPTMIVRMALGLSLVVTLEQRTGAFGVPAELLEPCIPMIAGVMTLI